MKPLVSIIGALLLLPATQIFNPLQACSLCNGTVRDTLGMEFERAQLVLYGQIANPRLNAQPGGAPGSGSTDFHVEKVLKDTTQRGPWKSLVVPRYLPVLDAKNPPHMLFFCDLYKDKLDPYHGRAASAPLVEYLQATQPGRSKDRVQALVHYARYLDHADQAVADDAFLEFAKSNDADVGQASKRLDPAFVRALVRDPKVDPDRLSLFAFLLGGCGTQDDARELRGMLDPPAPTMTRALDGILAGYIQLQPKDGWNLAYQFLGDRKQPFAVRFAVVRTLRFYHGWQPKEAHAQVLRGLSLIIPDGELADLAIEDLRQWQVWDMTKLILAQHGKASHAAPIMKRSIVRYALSCPLPEAREFVERVRRTDPDTVGDLEEYLQFERRK
jgi:hypothetical protein